MGILYNGFLKLFHNVWKKVEKKDHERIKNLVLPDNVSFEDHAYGDDPLQTFSIYYPKEEDLATLPVLIDIHGGGWAYGDKELNRPYCLSMASKGFVVMGMSYRLIEKVKTKDQFQDIIDAIEAFKKIAEEKGFDLSKVCLAGDSAGAYFALGLIAMGQNKKFDAIIGRDFSMDFKAVLLNHPAIDLEKLGHTHLWYHYIFRAMFGKRYKKDPLFKMTRNIKVLTEQIKLPKIFFLTSSGDDVVGEVNLYVAKELKEIDPSIVLFNNDVAPDEHVYNVAHINSSSAKETNDKVAEFFKNAL